MELTFFVLFALIIALLAGIALRGPNREIIIMQAPQPEQPGGCAGPFFLGLLLLLTLVLLSGV